MGDINYWALNYVQAVNVFVRLNLKHFYSRVREWGINLYCLRGRLGGFLQMVTVLYTDHVCKAHRRHSLRLLASCLTEKDAGPSCCYWKSYNDWQKLSWKILPILIATFDTSFAKCSSQLSRKDGQIFYTFHRQHYKILETKQNQNSCGR